MITAIRGSAPGPEKQIPVASFESLMNDVAGPARSPLEDVIARGDRASEVLAGVEPNISPFHGPSGEGRSATPADEAQLRLLRGARSRSGGKA